MQKKQNTTSIIWFRNNLRISDNVSLFKAIHHHEKVIAVYFFDPKYFEKDVFGFKKTEKFRAQFLIETITDLKENLANLNITLLTYFSSPDEVLPKICADFSVQSIYTQKEWTRDEVDTCIAIKKKLPTVQLIEDFDQFLYHPNAVSTNFSNIPDVFTEFRKGVEKKVKIDAQIPISKLSESNLIENFTKIPSLQELGFKTFVTHRNTAFPFKGGETEGLKRLEYYLFESKKASIYKNTRNGLVGIDYSTKFSPWLANGSISPKMIYWKLKSYEKEFGENDSTYWIVFELIWRDYFKFISLKYGSKIFKIGGILDRDYHWNFNKKGITDWIEGRTKDDFVNANMIELKETGWMSNRGRQNVASYFAKELLLDWRIGAAYFESMLLDYDVHSNYGNWVYNAGVGNDPRDRKFNIKRQAEMYDGDGKFQKMWLIPELF
jgi:deoxyribodipyrimidine photo-lyase